MSGALVVVVACAAPALSGQQEPSISSASIRLPASGSSSAEAYVTIQNPTTYDVEVQGASSAAAAAIELRQAGKEAPLTYVMVPAYGVLEMGRDGVYLLLKDLEKPLAEGDKVPLTIRTDLGNLTVAATVRKD
jgi:periplasmic copper chaperone A